MDRQHYDNLETKSETHITFILTIKIQGETHPRYVSKKERERYNDSEMGKDISKFLKQYRYHPNTNYNIQMITQIQSINTTILTEGVFKNPYVKEIN